MNSLYDGTMALLLTFDRDDHPTARKHGRPCHFAGAEAKAEASQFRPYVIITFGHLTHPQLGRASQKVHAQGWMMPCPGHIWSGPYME